MCRGHKQPTTGASEATRCLCLVRHSGGEPVDFLPVFPQSDPRAPEGPALHPCPLIPPCEHLTTARLCATASCESNEGRKVEDHEQHQTRRRSAQARRIQSRWRRPPAVAGDQRPTAPECPATGYCRGQRKPSLSGRSPLRLPHAVARLARRGASERGRQRDERAATGASAVSHLTLPGLSGRQVAASTAYPVR